MPRAELLADERVFRQRQVAGRSHDLRAADDDRPVVKRRIRREHVDEQLRADARLHLDAGFDQLVQSGMPLEDDQRADAPLGHVLDGLDQLHDALVHLVAVERRRTGEQLAPAELLQRAPQLRLEDDDDRDDAEGEHLVHEPLERIQIEPGADRPGEHQQQDALDQLHGARSAYEQDHFIDNVTDDPDIDDVPDPVLPRHFREKSHIRYPRPLPAVPSLCMAEDLDSIA